MNKITEETQFEQSTNNIMISIRTLRPQLNKEIKRVMVPKTTKLYDRYIRRFLAENNIYYEYSN
jgi:hypothetical protein